jgi:hypothetical protein
MRQIKAVLLTTAFALTSASIALAQQPAAADAQAHRLEGTWECYGPGQTHPAKPPIVWFGAGGGDSIEVDGFGGAVYGAADLSASDGATRVATRQGSVLLIRSLHDAGRKVSMTLSREGVGDYRCVRLPQFDAPMIPRTRLEQSS